MPNLHYIIILLPFVVLFIMTLLLLRAEGFIATRKLTISEHNPYCYYPKRRTPMSMHQSTDGPIVDSTEKKLKDSSPALNG